MLKPLLLASAALLSVFATIERRSAPPLIRLGVLRSGSQIRANLGAAFFFGRYVGFQFLVTQYMQSLLGCSALQTALAFLPAGANADTGRWLLRMILSYVVLPGRDGDEDRRQVTEFVVPRLSAARI